MGDCDAEPLVLLLSWLSRIAKGAAVAGERQASSMILVHDGSAVEEKRSTVVFATEEVWLWRSRGTGHL
jgi:hypothetical protein